MNKLINELKKRVFAANVKLSKSGLIVSTFGNVSEKITIGNSIYIGIKPSGMPYEKMTEDDIVILTDEGELIEGKLKPSSDTPTHLYLYKQIDRIQGITHSHSPYATAWAQAGFSIPCYGTTHADYDSSEIICTDDLSEDMIENKYEYNTGVSIHNALKENNKINANMVLVKSHGPFTFGDSANDSVDNAIHLEEISKIAFLSKNLNSSIKQIGMKLQSKHYDRKHGKNKYYGQ
jgi:L-ribulose-5-phosphate 4-epimerase